MRYSEPDLFIPSEQFRDVEYQQVGGAEQPVIKVRMRGSLTPAELEHLVVTAETPTVEAYEKFAPYIVGWNVAELDAKGKPIPVPPPAEGGGEMFKKIPQPLFIRIAVDVKTSYFRKVEPAVVTPYQPAETASPAS